MSLDYLTTAAIADEMRTELVGGRVQDVLQTARRALALEVYAGRRWYIHLAAGGGEELVLSRRRARRGEGQPTPLVLALKARAVGARLVGIQQPPLERILTFVFEGTTELRLVAELMGRLANLVLLDAEETILAVARPVTARMTSARTLLPGQPYQPPPTPAKAAPATVGPEEMAAWLGACPEQPAWRVLVDRVRAVSPLAAREIVARATGDAEATAAAAAGKEKALLGRLDELFALPDTHRWDPCVVCQDETVVAYAPYQLTHRPGSRPVASMHQALEAFVEAQRGTDPYRAARQEVARLIAQARRRVERRLAALERQRLEDEAIERLRLSGDLILAYQTRIVAGQTRLEAPFEPDRPPLAITLDPNLTPLENAQRYYRRYRRARRAAEALPRRLAATRASLVTLEQLATDLELAADRAAIDAVYDILVEEGYAGRSARRRAAPLKGPLVLASADGFTILVGRNSRQNEVVTFRRARRGDLWFHARDVPGSHVVVKAAGRPVPERTIRQAAGLAAHFSRARDQSQVPVAVVDVRYVRRLPGAGPGMVTFEQATTLIVAPLAPEELG